MRSLVLDARLLGSGIGTYTLNLISELVQHSDIPLQLLTSPQGQKALTQFNRDVKVIEAPVYSLREQFQVPRAVASSDVLHVPHYNAPLLRKEALLVTIHDLNHILDRTYRRTVKSMLYAQPMLRLVARRADHIFTVSEYSKCQIIEHLGVGADRISVVYNGIGAHIFPEDRDVARANTNRDFGFSGPYILFVGNLKANKNVHGLLKAFAVLQERAKVPQRLLIAGDDAAGRESVMDLTRELKLQNKVVRVPHVGHEQIRSVYSGADLTVLPSFEEGFGLPVVESMACGTPVACSSSASLPEIGGEAAEYFDPHDPESIATAIETVLLSSDRWRELQALGLKNACRFTREDFAERHLEVYRGFLG
jgi:glycosyltransferase involved in cell wall biosynthesis